MNPKDYYFPVLIWLYVTKTIIIMSKKKKNSSPDFGTNFETQNINGPLILQYHVIIGLPKIVEQYSDFL